MTNGQSGRAYWSLVDAFLSVVSRTTDFVRRRMPTVIQLLFAYWLVRQKLNLLSSV